MRLIAVLIIALAASLTRYAEPMVGTDAHGHTFPGACYPFGMIQLSPDTRPNAGDWDGCSGYHYSDSLIYGFSHTHLSGTGCDDWCDILVTPGKGPSRFSHKKEKASPGFYQVWLEDSEVLARMTVGRRVGMHEYRFKGKGPAEITIDLAHRDYVDSCSISASPSECSGCRVSSSWARGQKVYFHMEFSSPGIPSVSPDGKKVTYTFKDRKVSVRTAISSVSEEGARRNLHSEYPEGFRQLRKKTEAEWEKYLGKLECKGDPDIFYTALYHTAIHPSLYSDADGRYLGMDGRVHKADGWDCYTVFSTWDTFRGEHPLLFEIEPQRSMDFIRTMISVYEENGKLPVWELSSWETDCMIGYNSAPVIAEAVARGLTDFDVEKAYEAMVASSLRPEHGMESFRRNGLVLADDEHESVSKTLEFAYDDWCVAQVAKYLGREKDYARYMESAQYWRNVFDPSTGFMRARLNGRWFSPFDPREVNNNYTEANSWQYSFFVPQDIAGLIEALGGPQAFEHRLDSLFNAPEGNTGRTQADITGCIGQYAQGNEPSHHIPLLYKYVGKDEKGIRMVSEIMEKLYGSGPDGLCGNDDCGQMSAWYILNALGRYPVCPGNGENRVTCIPKSIVVNPAFEMESDIFLDSLEVSLHGEGEVFYRILPDEAFHRYSAPFVLKEACTMEAYSQIGEKRSFITRSTAHKIQQDKTIKILSRCSSQYTAGGPEGLIDGRRGGLNWRTGGWQGYQDTDFEAVVDLLKERPLKSIGAGFCQDARSWIWMPRYVEFSVSSDGVIFTPVGRIDNCVAEDDLEVQIHDYMTDVGCSARYIKVVAGNIGTIPEWHPGAGAPGFIFIDEIFVN